MEVVEAVPYTAWEQAVFVALFIVFVVGLLIWFTKQSDKWQAFIGEIDDKWRAFNREQRVENNCALADVRQGLSDLTQVTGKLVTTVDEMRADIYNHDAQAKEILALVQKPAAKPSPRKATPKE